MNVLIARDVSATVVELVPAGEVGAAPWGRFHDGNPLEASPLWPEIPAAARVGIWSGWLGEEGPRRDLRTWGPAGMVAMNQRLDAAIQSLGAGPGASARLLIRPHARHVLSDVQRCLTFLMERQGQPLGLLLDPAALLESSMVERAPEHLARALEILGPRADAVWLSNVARESSTDPDEPQSMRPCSLEGGLIDPALLQRLVRAHVPTSVARIMWADDASRAAEALG